MSTPMDDLTADELASIANSATVPAYARRMAAEIIRRREADRALRFSFPDWLEMVLTPEVIDMAAQRLASFSEESVWTIDQTKFRVGDRVTLHEAEITKMVDTYDPSIKVKFPSGPEDWFGVAEIVTHTPKPKVVKVGDKVMRGIYGPFEVLSLRGRYAWIERVSDKIIDTALISTLTPCETPHD